MADHPDHQERPLPFENIITTYPANVSAYRSTAVHVDNSGGADATVTVSWYMNDAPGVVTSESKTVPAGKATTLFFVNQGDTLNSVNVTGGGGGTTHQVSESNQLPLPSSGAGIQYDVHNSGDWLDIATTSRWVVGGPGIRLYATNDLALYSDARVDISASGANGVTISTSDPSGGDIYLDGTHGTANIVLATDQAGSHYLVITGLPTADPGVHGGVWYDAGGFLRIHP